MSYEINSNRNEQEMKDESYQYKEQNQQIVILDQSDREQYSDIKILSNIISGTLQITFKTNSSQYEKDYQEIGQSINKQKNIKQLKITIEKQCYIEQSNLICFIEAMQQVNSIQEFHIDVQKDNYFLDQLLYFISKCITNLPNLTILCIQIDESNTIDQGFQKLCDSVNGLTQLEEIKLRLSFEKLNRIGLSLLSNAISQIINITNINLSLSCRESAIFGISKLSYALKDLTKLKSFVFTINQNAIFDEEEATSFINAIQNIHSIQELVLPSLQKYFKENSLIQMFTSFQILQNIKILQLDTINTDTAKSLVPFLSSLPNLQELSLQFLSQSFMNNAFVCSLFNECISRITLLNRLEIYLECTIQQQGLYNLIQSFSSLSNLKIFTFQILNINNISQQNVDLLYGVVSSLKNLQKLNLALQSLIITERSFSINPFTSLTQITCMKIDISMKMNNSSIACIWEGLKYLPKLTCLHLDLFTESVITGVELEILAESMQKLTNLEELKFYLRGYTISDEEGVIKVLASLKELQQLISIEMLLNVNFSTQSSIQFGQSLSSLFNLQKLDLHFQFNMSISQLRDILSGLNNAYKLENLILKFKGNLLFNENSTEDVSHMFQPLINLKSLQFTANSLHCKIDKYGVMATGISQLTNLQDLNLSLGERIFIQSQSAVALGNCFKSLKKLQNLICRLQFRNGIQEETFQQGLASLTQLKNFYANFNCDQSFLQNLTSFSQMKNLRRIFIDIQQNSYIERQQQYTIPSYQIKNYEDCFANLQDLQISFNVPSDYTSFVRLLISLRNLKNLKKLHFDFLDNYEVSQVEGDQLGLTLFSLRDLKDFTIFVLSEMNDNSKFLTQLGRGISNLLFLERLTVNTGELNYFSSREISQIYLSLKHLQNLRHLQLEIQSRDSFNDCEMSIIGDSETKLLNLEYLQIIFNEGKPIPNSLISSIGYTLANAPYLNQLNLEFQENNFYGVDQLKEIGLGIQRLSQLSELFLTIGQNNQFNDQTGMLICQGLKQLKQLKGLEIVIKKENNLSCKVVEELLNSLYYLDNIKDIRYILSTKETIRGQQIIQFSEFIRKQDLTSLTMNLDEGSKTCRLSCVDRIFQMYLQISFENYSPACFIYPFYVMQNLSTDTSIDIQLLHFNQTNNDSIQSFDKELSKIQSCKLDMIFKNQIGKNIIDITSNLQFVPNLKYLKWIAMKQNILSREELVQVCDNLTKLKKLSNLEFKIEKQNNIELNDIILALHSLALIHSLREFSFSLVSYTISEQLNIKLAQQIKKSNPRLVKINYFSFPQ